MDNNKRVGAVLVVGGGIGGIQAALDLANAGFKVYLLEKEPSIGGVMPQLDKTFPTNDCSMCILAPKLVSVGRHPNIEIITNAQIDQVTGDAGDFTVHIKKDARYVIEDKCTGCGDCVSVCPITIPNEFDERLAERKAIFRLYPQAVPNAFKINKSGMPPCKDACPAGLSGQAYAAFIAKGQFDGALDYIRSVIPFPSICGRVCHHACEQACNRGDVDEPVAIMHLKRFVADRARAHGDRPLPEIEETREDRIAIIGGGPAGLTCAEKLRCQGYPVTVFDSSMIPGGMMTSCIPEYRLPKDIALYDAQRIIDLGVEFRGNVSVGKDTTLERLKKEGYKAIFIAIGVQGAKRLQIAGVDHPGVHLGIPFLQEVKAGVEVKNFGTRVIVIGGGNVAIDCARTARRLGAESVDLVCLETRDLTSKDRMPAHEWEIQAAEQEGIHIHSLLGPGRIVIKDDQIGGLETIECMRVYDEGGRFNPQFKEECDVSTIAGDTVILAVGQESKTQGFEELEWTAWKTLNVDPITLQTSRTGIFAGGDIVRGPASIIEAIADGNEAAISINRFLRNEDIRHNREKIKPELAMTPEGEHPVQPRTPIRAFDPIARVRSWDEVEINYSEEEAIREARRCMECGVCASCYLCASACKANAIDHWMTSEIRDLNVGAIILASGFDEYDARRKQEYGYGRYANVVTSIEFERILSASGPFEGHVIRPGDKKAPQRIAFIQCVGSRDPQSGASYCSSVCCTYAIKEAIIAKEHARGSLEASIFFMDMRTFGKGFEAYYERAQQEYKVRFVRAGVSKIVEDSQTKDLTVIYESEDGTIQRETFDMVVLSVGLFPKQNTRQLAKRLRVNLNEHGFCRTSEFYPVDTMRDGVFVCGVFSGPKDIPETVTQASAAAARAMELLAPARHTLMTSREYPPEIDVAGKEPRIGVFVCHCGINIGGYVKVDEVAEYIRTLPNVAHVESNLYTCSQDTQKRITQMIREHDLNRVVVASCTPRTHEPLFRETVQEAGLNPYLFEMANIRDQCSWIHMEQPDAATAKAKDLVRMAVAKARLLVPLRRVEVDIAQRALVIGGGIAGMTTSLSLAEQGFEVFLIEKDKDLGGHLKHIFYTPEGRNVQQFLLETIARVRKQERIRVFTDVMIKDITGFIGNYTTRIKMHGNVERDLRHGVVIVATGAQEYQPKEYHYGVDKRVVTQRELEQALAAPESPASVNPMNCRSMVMVQCIGSRDDDHPYCSRMCCTQAVKNALRLLGSNPDCNIYVLYRDVRTYGFKEDFYSQARAGGVIFIRYDRSNMPRLIQDNNTLSVEIFEPILKQQIEIPADLVVLSTGIEAQSDNNRLAQMLKIPLNNDRFFLEAHAKLRPVDFATEGIFVAGLAHSPKSIDETIAQAQAAASRAATILSYKKYRAEAAISHVNEDMCAGCGICKTLCPYEAITLLEENGHRRSYVNEALCKGCGTCVAACPSGAMEQYGFTKDQIMKMIETLR